MVTKEKVIAWFVKIGSDEKIATAVVEEHFDYVVVRRHGDRSGSAKDFAIAIWWTAHAFQNGGSK